MAAFLASVVSLLVPSIRRLVCAASCSSAGPSIPLPAVPHVVVPDDVVAAFDEVLVIGDVHGCFDELVQLLALAHASVGDAGRVLKILVGDLVNKGPKSRHVLRFLLQQDNRKTVLAVRGNHDDVVVDQVLNVIRKDASRLRDKNKWMLEVTDDELELLMQLPYTISVPALDALIVHAGVVPDVPLHQLAPRDLVSMRNLVQQEDGGYRASRSHAEGRPWAACWSGPTHVYFGHDAKRLLQREPFATGLDTGCVYGRELTALFIKGRRKGQFISVKAQRVYEQPSD